MGFATPGEGLFQLFQLLAAQCGTSLPLERWYAWEHPLRNFSFRNECWFSPSTKQLQPSPPGELPKTERYNTPPAERRTNSTGTVRGDAHFPSALQLRTSALAAWRA